MMDQDHKSLNMKGIIMFNLLMCALLTIKNTYKHLTDTYIKGAMDDKYIDTTIPNAINQFHNHVTTIIYMTPTYANYLTTKAKDDKGKMLLSARSQALLPNTYLNPSSLTTHQADLFNTYWPQYTEITNGKLKTKPLRREPP